MQCILKTDPFSNTLSENQRKRIITNLLFVGFQSKHKPIKHIRLMGETSYRDNFKVYLFKPINEYVAALIGFEVEVEVKKYCWSNRSCRC